MVDVIDIVRNEVIELDDGTTDLQFDAVVESIPTTISLGHDNAIADLGYNVRDVLYAAGWRMGDVFYGADNVHTVDVEAVESD